MIDDIVRCIKIILSLPIFVMWSKSLNKYKKAFQSLKENDEYNFVGWYHGGKVVLHSDSLSISNSYSACTSPENSLVIPEKAKRIILYKFLNKAGFE